MRNLKWKLRNYWILLMVIGLVSCLKEKDDTGDGPKTKITLINAALDSDPVTLVLDGEKLNASPVPFGGASGTPDNAYLPAKPGIRQTFWQVGAAADTGGKFFQWAPGEHYTLIFYDTAINNKAPLLMVADNPVPNDSLAMARVINCVAGLDSLDLWLYREKDTARLATKSVFIGRTGFVSGRFDARIRPGTWSMKLTNLKGELLYQDSILLEKEKIYSFLAYGEISGTGSKAPTVKKIVQLK